MDQSNSYYEISDIDLDGGGLGNIFECIKKELWGNNMPVKKLSPKSSISSKSSSKSSSIPPPIKKQSPKPLPKRSSSEYKTISTPSLPPKKHLPPPPQKPSTIHLQPLQKAPSINHPSGPKRGPALHLTSNKKPSTSSSEYKTISTPSNNNLLEEIRKGKSLKKHDSSKIIPQKNPENLTNNETLKKALEARRNAISGKHDENDDQWGGSKKYIRYRHK
jgi:hypothetical protein